MWTLREQLLSFSSPDQLTLNHMEKVSPMFSQTSKILQLQPDSVPAEAGLKPEEIDLDDALVPSTGLVNGLVLGTLLWLVALNLIVLVSLFFS